MATITLRPNAAGDLTQLTPYPSAPNWDNVNDTVVNNGTYNKLVYPATSLDDLYNIAPSGVGIASISQIQIFTRCIATTSSDGINITLKIGGSYYTSSRFNIGTSWESNSWTKTTNPKTGLAWTASDIESLQIGVYMWNILYGAGELRMSDIYVVVTYVPLDPPTVTTQAVTNILSTTATGNGNITVTGGENATKRGICWNLTGSPTVADSKSEEIGSFGTGAFTRPMTGLSPGVQYFVKAYAYNSAGYAYGGEVNFTTNKVPPTVTTQEATEVSQNHVKGNGNITSTGGENCSERDFEYGLTKTATWTKKVTVGGYGVGAFYLTIENLQTNTEYWYRAYAVNSIGTGYGEWVKFQTAASGTIPLGTKVSICSDYSGNTYKLNSSFTDDGETYQSFFVLSTDLAQKQGLHIYKRLEDLYNYFIKKASGTAKIYIKRDSEAEWQYAGEISMTGDEDIVVPHLPVDFLAKHYLIKFLFVSDFEYIGSIFESIPIGVR